MRRPSAGPDSGFTLIELLIAIILMGIICGVMADAFAVGIGGSQVTDKQLQESNDGSFTATWLTRDVQSSANVSTTTAGCSSGSLVLGLSWSEPTTSSTPTDYVDYIYSSGTLTRVQCGSVSRTLVVADQLSSAPSVTIGTCPGSSFSVQCVSMTLTEADGATFTVAPARRLP